MPTLGTLAAGIQSVSATRRSEVYITELGDDDQPLVSNGAPQWRKFQYFPESVSDTKQTNYQAKEVPGGSLPIYQWTGSGERQITFTAQFTADADHLTSQRTTDFDAPAFVYGDQSPAFGTTVQTSSVSAAVEAMRVRLAAAGVQGRNVFIPGALVWLRRFMLPRYGDNSEIGVPITKPPHKLFLHFTGSELERLGGAGGFSAAGGGILCVMSQCDITFDAFFPSGNPRIASVNLGFFEVAQRGGVVRFPSASELDGVAATWYTLGATARLGSGGS